MDPQKSVLFKLPLVGQLWIAAGLLVAVMIVSVLSVGLVGANADYICTKVVEGDTGCSNGSWGQWNTVSQGTVNNVATKVEQRVYTGTRTISKTLTYLNLRTQCDAGYTQTENGSSDSESGFHGGSVTMTSAVCQIAQSRTTNGGQVDFSSVQSDQSGPPSANSLNPFTSTTNVGSIEELNNIGNKSGGGVSGNGHASSRITATPSLVRAGETSVIDWQSSGVKSCTVVGSNGDAWVGVTGSQPSGAINGTTTYTLTCLLVDNTELISYAVVNIAPVYNEI